MTRRIFAALALIAGVVLLLGLPLYQAFAQSASDVAGAICSDQNRPLLLALLSIVVASAVTWSKRFMAFLPKPLQHAINLLALNWRQIAVAAKLIAPVILIGLFLAACTAAQVTQSGSDLTALCTAADQAAGDAQSQLKGGALDTANSIVVYEKSVCGSASAVAAAAADPTTAAFIANMMQQLKDLVASKGQ